MATLTTAQTRAHAVNPAAEATARLATFCKASSAKRTPTPPGQRSCRSPKPSS
jgi:hypothetical protein